MIPSPAAYPASTAAMLHGLLFDRLTTSAAVGWARDLWEAGREDEDIVALALLAADDWQEAQRLTPKVVSAAGLGDPALCHAILERDLLSRYLGGELDAAGLTREGYHLWVRLMTAGGKVDNPFLIYDQLGDWLSGERGIKPGHARARILRALEENGSFDRTALTPPVT